jgi:hypothetical protein
VLFADVATDWASHVDLVDRLDGLAEVMASVEPSTPKSARQALGPFEARVGTLANELARRHRADRAARPLLSGPDRPGAATHPDAGADRQAQLRAPSPLRRVWSVPVRRRGRYRHPPPTCAAFQAAKPRRSRTRGHLHDSRVKGHSYPQAWYEDAVGAILARIGRVDDATISEVVRLHDAYRPRVDELTLARIRRSREDATKSYLKTRDVAALQATMARLDTEERIAGEPVAIRRLTPLEIVDYTRSLPRLWADAGPNGRQAMVGDLRPSRCPGLRAARIRAHAGRDRPRSGRGAAARDRARKPDR